MNISSYAVSVKCEKIKLNVQETLEEYFTKCANVIVSVFIPLNQRNQILEILKFGNEKSSILTID